MCLLFVSFYKPPIYLVEVSAWGLYSLQEVFFLLVDIVIVAGGIGREWAMMYRGDIISKLDILTDIGTNTIKQLIMI